MKSAEGEIYLKSYPELERRWINQCVACQRKGYKPSMPRIIYPGYAAQNLRRYFDPLDVDELSLCEQCRQVTSSQK